MTTTLAPVHRLPTPRPTWWPTLRDRAPELVDDLADLWASLDDLDTTDHNRDRLRHLVEHLATLVGDVTAGLDPDRHYYDSDDPDPIIWPEEWTQPAPGRWEAQVHTRGLTIEASAAAGTSEPLWWWQLYEADEIGELHSIAVGAAHTLAQAKAGIDTAARGYLDEVDR